MKARPILMSAPMVQAILAERKTQTRRILKPQPLLIVETYTWPEDGLKSKASWWAKINPRNSMERFCPYGAAGDLLWLRESYYQHGHWQPVPGVRTKTGLQKWKFVPMVDLIVFNPIPEYRKGRHHQDPYTPAWHKRLGRFMPRSASRITLEITGIRVERLQEISEEDAIAEGVTAITKDGKLFKYGIPDLDGLPGNDNYGWHWNEWCADPRDAYRKLWESINGAGSWQANPWVWVIESKPHLVNVDAFMRGAQ